MRILKRKFKLYNLFLLQWFRFSGKMMIKYYITRHIIQQDGMINSILKSTIIEEMSELLDGNLYCDYLLCAYLFQNVHLKNDIFFLQYL